MKMYLIFIGLAMLLAFAITAAILKNNAAKNYQLQLVVTQNELDKIKKNNTDKNILLQEYGMCIQLAHDKYRSEWNRACTDHPENKHKDGTCHELEWHLASSIDSHHRDRMLLCETDYRNKMQALGIRQ